MFDIELNSFIVKFHQLRSADRYAHLDLHCEGGQRFVSLRVQLGEAGQQPHHRHHQQVRRGLRRSPAYHRRQERRKAARQAAEAEDATPPVPAPAPSAAEVEEPAAEDAVAVQRVTEAVIAVGSGVAATAKKIAEEAETRKQDAEEATKKKAAALKWAAVANKALVLAKTSSSRLEDDPDARNHPRDWPAPKWWCDAIGTYKHYHGNMKFSISKPLQKSMNYSTAEISHATFLRMLWTSMKTIPMNRDCFEPKYDLKEVFGTDVVKWTSVRDYLAPHVYFHSSKTGVFSGKKLES